MTLFSISIFCIFNSISSCTLSSNCFFSFSKSSFSWLIFLMRSSYTLFHDNLRSSISNLFTSYYGNTNLTKSVKMVIFFFIVFCSLNKSMYFASNFPFFVSNNFSYFFFSLSCFFISSSAGTVRSASAWGSVFVYGFDS